MTQYASLDPEDAAGGGLRSKFWAVITSAAAVNRKLESGPSAGQEKATVVLTIVPEEEPKDPMTVLWFAEFSPGKVRATADGCGFDSTPNKSTDVMTALGELKKAAQVSNVTIPALKEGNITKLVGLRCFWELKKRERFGDPKPGQEGKDLGDITVPTKVSGFVNTSALGQQSAATPAASTAAPAAGNGADPALVAKFHAKLAAHLGANGGKVAKSDISRVVLRLFDNPEDAADKTAAVRLCGNQQVLESLVNYSPMIMFNGDMGSYTLELVPA